MRTSDAGLKALMEREGYRNRAYPDSQGNWTIGVGHTGPEVHPGLYWDDEQCAAQFRQDIERFEAAVGTVRVKLSQNQYDALVSFSFNIGDDAFLNSTLLRLLNAGDYRGASAQFRRWVIPPEITSRRAGEWVQFNTPDGEPYPARSTFDARFP